MFLKHALSAISGGPTTNSLTWIVAAGLRDRTIPTHPLSLSLTALVLLLMEYIGDSKFPGRHARLLPDLADTCKHSCLTYCS